jgi:hypothetical protein
MELRETRHLVEPAIAAAGNGISLDETPGFVLSVEAAGENAGIARVCWQVSCRLATQ